MRGSFLTPLCFRDQGVTKAVSGKFFTGCTLIELYVSDRVLYLSSRAKLRHYNGVVEDPFRTYGTMEAFAHFVDQRTIITISDSKSTVYKNYALLPTAFLWSQGSRIAILETISQKILDLVLKLGSLYLEI